MHEFLMNFLFRQILERQRMHTSKLIVNYVSVNDYMNYSDWTKISNLGQVLPLFGGGRSRDGLESVVERIALEVVVGHIEPF